MSESKFKRTPNLFKDFFKSVYVVVALLFTLLAFTFIVFVDNYSVLEKLSLANYSAYAFLIVVGVIFTLFAVAYVVAKLKNKKIGLNDSLTFAASAFGLVLLIYSLINISDASVFRLVFAVLMLLASIGLLFFRQNYYLKQLEDKNIVYTKNTIFGYYRTIIKKYKFFTPVIIALLAIAVVFLMHNNTFSNIISETFKSNAGVMVTMLIMVGVLIAYVCQAVSSKKITFLDLLLASGLIIIPFSLVAILMLDGRFRFQIIWAAILGVYLVLMFVRFMSFDLKQEFKATESGKGYIKDISNKYGILTAIVVASILVALITILTNSSIILVLREALNGTITFDIRLVMFVSIIGVCGLTLVICYFTSFATMNAKSIRVGDFMLIILAFVSIFGIALYVVDFIQMIISLKSIGLAMSTFLNLFLSSEVALFSIAFYLITFMFVAMMLVARKRNYQIEE